MLVESDAVETELFHASPRIEVLPVGLDGERGPEMLSGERVGQLAVGLEVVKVLRIWEQVEAEHAHRVPPCGPSAHGIMTLSRAMRRGPEVAVNAARNTCWTAGRAGTRPAGRGA